MVVHMSAANVQFNQSHECTGIFGQIPCPISLSNCVLVLVSSVTFHVASSALRQKTRITAACIGCNKTH